MTLFAVAVVVLLAFLIAGFPIALSLMLVGTAGFALVRGVEPATIMIGQVALDSATNYSFSVLPLFVLMGNIIGRTSIAVDLYTAVNTLVGHRRGGLAMATVGACGGFAAISGSSYACAATMTGIAVPPMRQYSYAPGFAAASVSVGGTLGVLIPPSIGMVFYALITGVPLGELMIAGILPGLLTIGLYMTAIALYTRLRPEAGPKGARFSWRERGRALAKIWPVVVLFVSIIGGIYLGVFTAMEAAGVGAGVALVMALARRVMSLTVFRSVLVDTVKTSANLYLVFFGALLFANFVTIVGVPVTLNEWISASGYSPLGVLAVTLVVYLLLGCILESSSLLLLTLPVFFPVLTGLGYDPIWFGIFVIVVAEVGLITPPIGMNVYVVSSMLPDVPPQSIFAGLWPFLAADVVRIALLVAFPAIVTLLPRLM